MEMLITKRKNGSKRVQIKLQPGSKVEQSHQDECNINSIISRYVKSGMLPVSNKKALYGNFVNCEDFHQVQNQILEAQAEFLKLPAEIKDRFDNDPGILIEFLNNPVNEQEAIKLGLMPKKETAEPEIVNNVSNETPAVPEVIVEGVK